ncbi:hypothetical protein HZH66_012900 [Vespula vulgaris]|uniref:Uncharacterized protein n=1 Tax=Vespula vulgaris TaxID=7454 RepID=A0A834MSF4_VESVU|nr:hypothetical protein HZH66_012900 [Vespula vulgaris]
MILLTNKSTFRKQAVNTKQVSAQKSPEFLFPKFANATGVHLCELHHWIPAIAGDKNEKIKQTMKKKENVEKKQFSQVEGSNLEKLFIALSDETTNEELILLTYRNIGNFENPLVESNHALGARINSDQNENSVNSIGYSVIGLGYLVKSG